MKLISDPESQPKHEVAPSKQRSNVSAYTKYIHPEELYEDRDTVLKNVSKGMNSPEFQAFVTLVGKDAANGYLRRMLENKTKD